MKTQNDIHGFENGRHDLIEVERCVDFGRNLLDDFTSSDLRASLALRSSMSDWLANIWSRTERSSSCDIAHPYGVFVCADRNGLGGRGVLLMKIQFVRRQDLVYISRLQIEYPIQAMH